MTWRITGKSNCVQAKGTCLTLCSDIDCLRRSKSYYCMLMLSIGLYYDDVIRCAFGGATLF